MRWAMGNTARFLAQAAALGALACTPPPDRPGDDEAHRQTIVGGGLDVGDPEAFMIQFQLFGLPNMCSAVLVGQRTLLTAAHCVGAGTAFRAVNATRGRGAPAIDIVDLRTHPSWSWGTASASDLAVALLKSAPPGVSPKPRAAAPPPTGGTLRVVGYGYTAEDDYTSWGDKHVVELPARSVDPSFITLGDRVAKGFCDGDSGGPSFHRFPDGVERLVGIHIEGATCTDGRDVRVDVHARFIDDYLAEKERPTPPPPPPPDAPGWVEPAAPTRPLPPPAAEVEPSRAAPPSAEPTRASGAEPERVYLRPDPRCGCSSAPAALAAALPWATALRRQRGSTTRPHRGSPSGRA